MVGRRVLGQPDRRNHVEAPQHRLRHAVHPVDQVPIGRQQDWVSQVGRLDARAWSGPHGIGR
jgi:hypothetical protein